MLQDLRFALRLMVKERWFAAVAILVTAVGIGANSTAFTLVNAALIRGLPFEESERLHVVTWRARAGTRLQLSYPELDDLRAQSRSFESLAAYTSDSMNISGDNSLPEQVRGAAVTSNTFGVLRQRPRLGRDFAAAEDLPGAAPVAIIGHGMWRTRYGADPNIVGRTMRVDGRTATIVGVMPETMKFPSNTDLWIPLAAASSRTSRNTRDLNVFGRLQPGIDRRQAEAELAGIAERLATAYPDSKRDFVGVQAETFTDRFVGGNGRRMFGAIMGAVCFVLLIACMNVANLLLSRSGYRAREIAVRIAMGATRWRVIRQLLIENVVLAFIGGSIGLLLTSISVQLIDASIQDADKPYWITFTIDYAVVAYVAGICVLTAVLFGMAPALHVSKTNTNDVLKEGGRGATAGARLQWMSSVMVVVELTLTVVLLAAAGLMMRSFFNVYALDIGVKTDNILAMRMQLPEAKYETPDARRRFYERIEQQLSAVPGVESMAVTTSVPGGDTRERPVEIEGKVGGSDGAPLYAGVVTVSSRFFQAAGVKLVQGRTFIDQDGAPGSEAVLVNERLVSELFPGQEVIGRRLRFARISLASGPASGPVSGEAADVWRTIVGVTPSIRHGSVRDRTPDPIVYLPVRQEPPSSVSLLVRSQLPPGSIMNAVRREVQAIDVDQPVFTIETLAQIHARNRWPYRVFGTLFAIFAAIALIMSSVGLYAVMAYSVTQRRQEIAVRMALGAQGSQMRWLILRRGLAQLAFGLAFGFVGALILSRVLRRMLAQVAPTDPATYIGIATLLTLVSIAACLLPARRATRVDPLVALREG